MKWNYLVHLLAWALPILALQWFVGWRTLARNARVVLLATFIGGTYYSIVDAVAVESGIWFFDPAQNLGLHVGPLPVEEILFFYLTSALVAQSMVLFLPARFRR